MDQRFLVPEKESRKSSNCPLSNAKKNKVKMTVQLYILSHIRVHVYYILPLELYCPYKHAPLCDIEDIGEQSSFYSMFGTQKYF